MGGRRVYGFSCNVSCVPPRGVHREKVGRSFVGPRFEEAASEKKKKTTSTTRKGNYAMFCTCKSSFFGGADDM